MKRNVLLNDVLPREFQEIIELGQMLWQRPQSQCSYFW